MKGMILKDVYLLKELRKMVVLFTIISIILILGGEKEVFVMGYFNILMLSIATNSTAYDDYNNGYSFLFTLPVTRREYVREKYLFSFLVSFGGWLFTVIITTISLMARGKMNLGEWVPIWLIFLGIAVLGLSVAIPAAIKYGSDKGRIMLIVFMAAIFAVIIIGQKLAESSGIDLDAVIYRLLDGRLLPYIFAAVIVLAVFISYSSSVKIMEKKEF